MRRTGRRRALRVTVGLALAIWIAGCREPPPALRVDERLVRVENQTPGTWTGVEIWVNDHYRVTRPTLEPGERLDVPLDTFVAGFGQRFDAGRQPVRGVELSATAADGTPVRLVWGAGRRR